MDPNPAGDHDPFSLGDSDDEDNKKKDVRAEDTARLKGTAKEAVLEDVGSGSGELRAAERSGGGGVRDKEAEEMLVGK